MFNLKRTKIYSAVKWEKVPFLKFADFLKKIFLILFLLIFLSFLYGFVPQNFPERTNESLLGATIIFLVLFSSVYLKTLFFETKLKKPKLELRLQEVALDEDYNMAEFLDFESAEVIDKTLRRGPSSTHLLFFLLKCNPKLNFVFSRLLLNMNEIKKQARKSLKKDETSFNKTITESIKEAVRKKHQRIMVTDILSALTKTDEVFKNVLLMSGLKKEDVDSLAVWFENIEEKREMSKRFWEYENLAKRGTLAKEWTAGFTITLDKYSNDITELIRKIDSEFIGHEDQINIMARILSRGEINNVLLIGEEGTGKRSMVYALAKLSLLGKTMPSANYKRFVELDLSSLLAQMESSEEVESVLDQIFSEVASAGNIILVIDGMHNYIGQEARPGVIDISGIMAPYLRLPQFQIIGITNYEGLHRNIEKNPSILSLFGKVEVLSIQPEKTLILLEYMTFALEQKYNIFISYPAIRDIIELTDKYFPSLYFPEKAIDILDEVAVYVSSLPKEKVVLPRHVAHVITEKSEVPVGELESKERDILLNLEDLIHQRIINQEEAVREVSTALRRARSEITVRKGPMGAFLFLGPTGVGKTETCKALAHFYFGSENKIIRLDMSEFQSITDIGRLIGSEKEPGILTTPIKENPFSLLLLDELEKADHNVLNLFLQVLDEGHITDGLGRRVSFRNTIIIATSNAGYQVILQALKENQDWDGVKSKILDYLFDNNIFRPEFINRFDAAVIFKPLSKKNLLDISQLMLDNLKDNLIKKGVELIITEKLKEKIVELGYDPVFGARQMRRVLQSKVENVLASALINKEIERGDKISIDPETFAIINN